MVSSKEKIVSEVKALYDEGTAILIQEMSYVLLLDSLPEGKKNEAGKDPINQKYQTWYTRCIAIIRSLIPERFKEFVECYEPDQKRKRIDGLSYTIKDYLYGINVVKRDRSVLDIFGIFKRKMEHQLTIIGALLAITERRVENIETIIQANLFDNELDIAAEMSRKGHLRAAGAIIGVVFEAHLKHFAANKSVDIGKKTPTISDFNEALKADDVIDTPVWRHIQRLGDIRNMCVHSKEREPTKDEINDLLNGVKKYIAELN
jgi:hypothetical protein